MIFRQFNFPNIVIIPTTVRCVNYSIRLEIIFKDKNPSTTAISVPFSSIKVKHKVEIRNVKSCKFEYPVESHSCSILDLGQKRKNLQIIAQPFSLHLEFTSLTLFGPMCHLEPVFVNKLIRLVFRILSLHSFLKVEC